MSASHEENVMSIYPILSALLTYPEQPLLDALPDIERALDARVAAAEAGRRARRRAPRRPAVVCDAAPPGMPR